MFGITYHSDEDGAHIDSFLNPSAVKDAGLKEGDIITAVNGVTLNEKILFGDVVATTQPTEYELTYSRDGATGTVIVTPNWQKHYDLGFTYTAVREKSSHPLGDAIDEMGYGLYLTTSSLKALVTGRIGINSLSGPVGVVQTMSEGLSSVNKQSRENVSVELTNDKEDRSLLKIWEPFLTFLVLISVNLGFLNLLPIPALDGGHLVFLLAEAIRRKPVSVQMEQMAYRVSMMILLLFSGYIMIKDIVTLFFVK